MNESRPFAPRGPVELHRLFQETREQLRKVDNDLQQAHEFGEQAEEAWTEHYDEICQQLEEESENGKVPGEDIRLSLARRRGGAEKWTNLRRAERLIKRLNKRQTNLTNQVSSLQTEARMGR